MTDFFEYIDEYKAGSLPAELQLAFEGELKVNTKLKHAVENYDLLKKISASLIEDETREKIKDLKSNFVHSETNDKKGKLRHLPVNRKWMAIAASFFAITIAMFIIFSNLSNPPEQALIAMEQDLISQDTRGEHESNTNDLDKAITLYEDKKYDLAKPLFEGNFQSDSLNFIANKYLAHIYFKKSNYTLAIEKFETLESNKSYGYLAKYHLVLCYLLQKDKAKARLYYDQIKESRMLSDLDRSALEEYLE